MTGRPYVESLVFAGGISAEMRAWVDEHPDFDREVAWATEGKLSPGGRAANASVAAVRLGRKFVDLVGCVGDDLLGESMIAALKEEGMSVRLVDRVPGAGTSLQQVVVDSKGERRTVGVANANWQCSEAHIRKSESSIFGADLMYATLEIPMPAVRRLVAISATRKVPVLLDATPVPTPGGDDVIGTNLASHVDVLLANWNSASRMAGMAGTGGPVAVEMAKRLLAMGPKAVVITMGEHGALVAIRGKHALVQPPRAQVADVTAAGDVFGGALAVALTSQARGDWRWEQLIKAVEFATAAASVCVSRVGGRESFPTRADVERQLASSRI
jgi:ribokinase